MEWRDEGILLNVRAYGERTLLASVFARDKGLVKGIVYKNTSKATLQMGVHLKVTWKARLETHMGRFDFEALPSPHIFLIFDKPEALCQLQTLCYLLPKILPERHPYPALFQEFLDFLKTLTTSHSLHAQALFQLRLLHALGYGLDLTRCVATGETENLTHVSPKSGRAVCSRAALPYQNKLLSLPAFFLSSPHPKTLSPSENDIKDGLKLTQFFIEKHLLVR